MSTHFETIVDGLADQGYAVVDNFLSTQEVDSILDLEEFKSSHLHFKKAGIGKQHNKQINETIRGDYIQWIDKKNCAKPLLIYLDRLERLIQHLNQNLFLSLKDYEVHMTAYPAGSFYKRHIDQFKSNDHRKLSIICYLNSEWKDAEGGQLRMHTAGGVKDVSPTAGRVVCFRSDLIEHEVLPATRQRLSLTGWLLDQLTELKHL
ncbi:MAG: 2OG-Fe(II) oxygenase [Bacteroidia bacterium]|nr:2OG-Fe(II) oxygenase [Bacteroidia bacterium]